MTMRGDARPPTVRLLAMASAQPAEAVMRHNTELNLVLTIAADGKTATFLNVDGLIRTLHRVAPHP